MKGKKCFGLLLLLSIIFGLSSSVFLESANAVSVDLSNFDVTYTTAALEVKSCITRNLCGTDSGWSSKTWNALIKQTDLYGLKSDSSYSFKRGDIVELSIVVKSFWTPDPLTQNFQFNVGALGNRNFDILSYDTVFDSSFSDPAALNGSSSVCSGNYCYVNNFTITNSGYLYKVFRLTIMARNDGTFPVAIGSLSNSAGYAFRITGYPNNNEITEYGLNYNIADIVFYRKNNANQEMNEKDDEDRSNLESQSSTIDSSSEDSGDSAESTGTTLLAAFTSFVGAITSASPSNCNIDMDMGNLDLGVVNLCQLSPPPGFSSIASIFLILFCVPLSIATARKVISLFRSFQ